VRSLARQRKKAERSEELAKRRFAVELTLASRDMAAWKEELVDLETRVVELRESEPQATAAVADAERQRVASMELRTSREAARGELSRLLSQHQQSVQELRSEIAVAEERRRHAVERRQRAEEEQRDGALAGERLVAEQQRATEEVHTLATDVASAEAQVLEAEQAEEQSRAVVAQCRSAVDAAEQTLRGQRDQMRRLELDRESAHREVQELEVRSRQLVAERQQLVDVAAGLQREIAGADETMSIAARAVAETQIELEAMRGAARLARDADAGARGEMARAQDQVAALDARLNALEGLERERVGLAPAAARLLRERDRFGEGAIIGPISDFLSAGSSSAVIVERFLGMTLHAVVVRDRQVADAVRSWHASTNPGPLLILPLDAAADEDAVAAGDLLPQVEVAPTAATWVRRLLAAVTSIDEGTAFVDARGAMWLPGSAAGPGPLRRRAELFGLRAELQAANDALTLAMAAAEQGRAALVRAESEAAAAGERAAAAQAEHRRANEMRAELERRRLRGLRELEEADALAGRMQSHHDQLLARIAATESGTAEVTASLGSHEDAVVTRRHDLATAEQALETRRDERATRQITVAQLKARQQVAGDRLRRLDQEHQSAAQRLSALAEELSTLSDADRQLALQMDAWQSDFAARSAALRDVETRFATAESDVAQADRQVQDADTALDAARRFAHEREVALHHAELRFAELSGKRAAIKERLEAEWRRPLEDLLASYEAVDMDDDALRGEADQLRGEVEKLGPVNPLAIEEHEAELKRFDFLTAQRNDLTEAKSKLQLAIREIDTTAREMFLTTFSQVRENFRSIFMTLFGGGECDLRLENPELPLDCDIEIHASPRGKRTQRIHLLSSGERALVALSLLFGIFLTKPSPFCLLDEVDAPLDDANIGRYVRMLTQFKSNTQFIVITHNPRTTTEAADAVYGVTMQEPGVSSLVSVRMRGPAVDEATGGEDRLAEEQRAEVA
jgi:chromosome segregation protein